MISSIEVKRLKEHPKNKDYFADVQGEKYEEIKRSIEINGIRDPLKVLPDFTVVAGHQRWRIAKELGIEKVPCMIVDVEPEEAEYLLIADNVERRGDDNDPMRKAKRAEFLKTHWGVKQGKKGQNVPIKTMADVGQAIGEDERTTKRLLKLNDLIAPLQALVSSGKLGTTAAEQLAYLTPEDQKALYDAFGETIGEQSIGEVKQLRASVEKLRQEKEQSERAYQQAQAALRDHQQTVEELRQKLGQAQSKSDVETVQADLENAQSQIEQLQERLAQAQSEKKLVEAGVQKLAEEQAQKLLAAREKEWEVKLQREKEKNKELARENNQLTEENQKMAQQVINSRGSEFERAGVRNQISLQMNQLAADFEKTIVAVRDAWNNYLEGDPKMVDAIAFYMERFHQQIEMLRQITEGGTKDVGVINI